MIAHHRHHNFFWQLQKFLIKASQYCRRKLGEVDDRVQKTFIFTPARTRDSASGAVERFTNLLLALAAAQNSCRAQGFNISRTGFGDQDWAFGETAVTSRLISR